MFKITSVDKRNYMTIRFTYRVCGSEVEQVSNLYQLKSNEELQGIDTINVGIQVYKHHIKSNLRLVKDVKYKVFIEPEGYEALDVTNSFYKTRKQVIDLLERTMKMPEIKNQIF